jgi:hypothetical protein
MKKLLILAVMAATCAFAQSGSGDWKAVESAMGRGGAAQPDGAYKFGMPRSDLKVTVDGVAVKPGLALRSWAAFSAPGDGAMAMGDLVLAEDEVSPVVAKLQDGGIEVTAIHNHLLHETPRVMYVHFHAHGNAVKIAQALHEAIAATKTPASTAPPAQPPALGFDQSQVESALGYKGKNNGGVLQFSVPRQDAITSDGMRVPNSMGVATAINFQSTDGGKAAITGDFVLVASEVNPVITALRQNGIAVTALHSHMLDDQPRLFFMHFWANDDAGKLARGLHSALEKMKVAKQ